MRRRGWTALALVLTLTLPRSASAAGIQEAVAELAEGSAAYVYQAVPSPSPGSIGGEWAVIALARSGYLDPQGDPRDRACAEGYLARLEEILTARGGVLHQRKYTEYSRAVLALTALGADPADVGGYDLLAPLADFDKTIQQGTNGPIWALIALDSGGYAIPAAPTGATQATRQTYVEELLSRQLENGGWSLTDRGGRGEADADVTGMALQALAPYRDQSPVAAAIADGLGYLSNAQNDDGGFSSRGEANLESAAQVAIALCALGIDPDTDARFLKNGHSAADALLACRRPDGSFSHVPGGEADQMASEQGLCALAALRRLYSGRSGLYDMSDASSGPDLTDSAERPALPALARRGILWAAYTLLRLL